MTTYETHGRAIARKTGQKSDYILRSEVARDRARTLTGCLFCSWSLEGPAGEAREASLEHRRSHHPDRPLRLKRRGGKLVKGSVSYPKVCHEGTSALKWPLPQLVLRSFAQRPSSCSDVLGRASRASPRAAPEGRWGAFCSEPLALHRRTALRFQPRKLRSRRGLELTGHARA